ncbi:RagB/SusD family nutrient uptake outer membrane protein [Arenibacter palladensis]|uniref:RagB/SusD family nutrient uptake outer membrane protein n=1 Tax=Arenibacter palladensis TaxID=237373 RepID=UPI0026E2D4FD|nr:RagB/SusD family nutrient uptake outer membrane protein [Arenibacter palladensis]MDO6602091.1 RagB/SusD family nutrient uptake outer membrane protein [Arenibacter palladensis]
MKINKNIKQGIALLVISIALNSCNEYIQEDAYSDVTSETFLNEDNADQLVVGVYTATRATYRNHGYKFEGTDIFTTKNELFSFSSTNDYTNFVAPETNGIWTSNYNVVAKANTAINRYENQISWSDNNLGIKAYGIAQARALRALAFFNLVVQYGGVELGLEEPLSIRNDYTRSTEEETFSLIISELEAAIPNLENEPATGRFSKRAAQHLLSEVYLTRAYKSFAGSNDFQTAADLAVQAIGSYDIRSQSFAQVFDYDNQVNPEILFAAQWENNEFTEDRNNNKHSLFMYGVQELPGVSRANQYGVSDGSQMMTPYFYSLFEDNDSREDATIHRVLYADEDSSWGDDTIVPGDTIVYFPKQALDLTELTDKLDRYWVYQPDQYLHGKPADIAGVNYLYSTGLFTHFPIMKKFDDEVYFDQNGGARDTFIFRVAGTHLLAAEAFLGAGNTAQALFHLNRVRERATGVADHYSTIDLEDILVENALELAGEDNRWAVLKRMGKLEERINLYNPHVIDHGAFDSSKHLLRPIPTREIALSPNTMVQNPNY